MIGNHSQTAGARRWFRVAVRLTVQLVLVCIALSWLFLYFDSVYQRRKAEALFADLKSLDFATAGFSEVRDIMIRNGGAAMQRRLLPRFPDLGVPVVDNNGNVTFPRRPQTTCTPRDCWFQLHIMTLLPRIPLQGRKAIFLYTALPYVGIRSWGVGAEFEVRDGKLYGSSTGVFEYRMEHVDYNAYRQLIPLEYGVGTRRDAASDVYSSPAACWPGRNQDYRVYVSHGVFKFPADELATCVVQSAQAATKRAFDVHLSCLNNPFRNCRFDELAPSVWADYSARDRGTGAADSYK